MRRFLLNTAAFMAVFAAVCFVIVAVDAQLYKIEQKSRHDHTRHLLLLGDSNMECAINDALFTAATNRGQSSEPYFYAYLKLKDGIAHNQAIDTVLLSFSPHNIFDNGWLLDEGHLSSRFRHYFILMGWKDGLFLLSKKPRAVISAMPSALRQSLKNIGKTIVGKKIDRPYGGFLNLDRNILDEVKLKLEKNEPLPFFNIPDNFAISQAEFFYLEKVVALCDEQNIKLYFIGLPKRVELLDYPKYGLGQFYAVYDERFRHVDFIDLSRMELPDDHYGDFVHLNRKGSTNLSTFMQQNGIPNLFLAFGRH